MNALIAFAARFEREYAGLAAVAAAVGADPPSRAVVLEEARRGHRDAFAVMGRLRREIVRESRGR